MGSIVAPQHSPVAPHGPLQQHSVDTAALASGIAVDVGGQTDNRVRRSTTTLRQLKGQTGGADVARGADAAAGVSHWDSSDDPVVFTQFVYTSRQPLAFCASGSERPADRYIEGPNGCAIAKWDDIALEFQTEVVTSRISKDGSSIEEETSVQPPGPKNRKRKKEPPGPKDGTTATAKKDAEDAQGATDATGATLKQ